MKAGNPATHAECKLTCDLEVLRQSPVFAGADSDVLKLFAYLAARKKYRVGDKIITEGKEAEKAYYLISGTTEVTVNHRGNEVILQQLQPQTFFGELALLARFKWFFSVYPVSECEILEISRESFQKILEKFPDKRDKLIEKIVQLRIQRLSEQTVFMLDKMPGAYAFRGATTI
jgi:CRP/FNR family transcriptional regulator, cyclic AMP receptor protein